MQNFTDYATTGPTTRTHLPHLEDLVFQRGGANVAVDILLDLGDLLEQSATSRLQLSVKWDGSPSIVFGPDPADEQFFVSTKAALSQTRKLAKSHAEISALFDANVASILHPCLDYLPLLEPQTVLQGDFLFRAEDLVHSGTSVADGRPVVTSFQPNTIRYSVPYDSQVGRRIRAARIGIAIHTAYINWVAEPVGFFDKWFSTPLVFAVNTTYRHNPTLSSFTPEDTRQFNELMMGDELHTGVRLKQDIYDELETEPLARLLPMFINTCVRMGLDPNVGDFAVWMNATGKLHAEKYRKTLNGKVKLIQRYGEVLANVVANRAAWYDLFSLHRTIQSAKNLIVHRMAAGLSDVSASIGDKPTAPEGFVATIPETNISVKLVDRSVFSRANLLRPGFSR